MMNKIQQGFTLVELMVTVSITGILAVSAAPSFQSLLNGNIITSKTNELVKSIYLARSEAISSGGTGIVCASSNQNNCNLNWSDGWIVLDNAGNLVQTLDGLPSNINITVSNTSPTIFTSRGFLSTPGARTYTLCDTDSGIGKTITVATSGLPRTQTLTNCSGL